MRFATACTIALLCFLPNAATADEFCEPAFQDCRARLLSYIGRETVRIDVGTTLMEDLVLTDAIIARHRAGVRVRVISDVRRRTSNPLHGTVMDRMRSAGIPIRYKLAGAVYHWKVMIFGGQQAVEFSGANFSPYYLVPVTPYRNYTDDPLYFTADLALLHSFQRVFDDLWVDTVTFGNWANVTTLARAYPLYTVAPSLNFVPFQNFATRAKPYYDAETQRIDVINYKITEPSHVDGIIRARRRSIPVRLLVEPTLYRSAQNVWQAYNIDRMYAAGVQVRERAHEGFLHQKTTLLYSQGVTIFGSSNWTNESNRNQYEHNYFATASWFFAYFKAVFDRKWNNSTGAIETRPFVPLPPDAPVYVAPANTSSGHPTTIVLSWKPGKWAHRADVYFGTTSPPPLYLRDVSVTPSTTKKLTIAGLLAGRTYYWRIVSKTMANKTTTGPTWSFATF
jgi:hypothetical protein